MGVLIAGGTGALGGAVVRELIDAGYDCTVTWVVEKELERAREELGDRVQFVRADLVGGFSSGPLVHETSWDDFEGMLRLNLAPAFNLAHAAMPRLVERGGGAFVAVSARAALRPLTGAAAYVTSKAAVLAFIHALDADYRSKGVRANAILPSVIDTPANRESMPDADHSKWVPPEQIAKVVRFLVSDDSAPTSGAGIPVYGRA